MSGEKKSKVEKCDTSKQKIKSYVWLTLKHKYFVFLAGIKVGCPIIRLIKHDISKLGRKERPYYQDFFFGEKKDPDGFARAWLHHQSVNDHHWEYWIPRTGHAKNNDPQYGSLCKLEMTDEAILEMISDWIGASRAYGGQWPQKNNWPWLTQELKDSLSHLHPNTAIKVYKKLIDLNYIDYDENMIQYIKNINVEYKR